jgi:hypothetical protein
MDKIILPSEYYPVYKDISDLIGIELSERRESFSISVSECPGKMQNQDALSSGIPLMLNSQSLLDLSAKFGFSTIQTVILLLKNAFEGHVYLNFNIRPDQLCTHDKFKFEDKQEMLILSFYEQFDLYWEGLDSAWTLLQGNEMDLSKICFESLINSLIADQIIRFPVLFCNSFDISKFNRSSLERKHIFRNQVHLTLIGVRALTEYVQIENVNIFYEEKFKNYIQQLHLKEDVLSHYDRKLVFAFNPDIKNEDELDVYLFKYLVESRQHNSRREQKLETSGEIEIPHIANIMLRIRDKIKLLYRLISKNCNEVHTSSDTEKKFPELHQVFQEANTIYNENISECSDALMLNMRMVLLFSKVMIYRKTNGLAPVEGLHIEQTSNQKEALISEEDIQIIRRKLEAGIADLKIKSNTEYKTKYIKDEELTETHKIYLQKQIEFIDQQITDVQNEIKEVLNLKSHDICSKQGFDSK